MGIEHFSHFIGGDILRAPAKGVLGAIDKLVMLEKQSKAYIHKANQIAGVKPVITSGLHVVNIFALGRCRIGIPIELGIRSNLRE